MNTMACRWGMRVAGALVLLATAVAGVAADEDRVVRVKVDVANIRSGPGTDHERLWAVERNFALQVLDQRGRWLKTVDFIGDEGWIYAPLTDQKPSVVVESDVANIRGGPGPRHAVRWVAEWGTGLRVLDRKGSWLKVEHAERGQGWIHSNLVWGDTSL